MLVTTADNYGRTRARAFALQGVKARHRLKARRIAPGDEVCWYLVGVVREPDDAIPAAALVERLAFARRWPRAHWGLAFQGNLHEIGRRDFRVVQRALAS